jgi:hypothetical protein
VKQRGAGATRIARVPTPEQAAAITDPSARALFQQYQVPTSPSGQIQTSAGTALTSGSTLSFRRQSQQPGQRVVPLQRGRRTSRPATGLTFIGSNLPGFGATSQGKPRQSTAATRGCSATRW